MNRLIAFGIFALIAAVLSVPAFGQDAFKGVEGHYERENAENGWHVVVISTAPDRGPYAWVNREGKRWTVGTGSTGPEAEGSKKRDFLSFGDDTEYPGHTFDIERDAEGKVTALLERDGDGNPLPKWVRKATPVLENFEGVVGNYELENASNNWHYVAINTAPDRGPFAWVNREGKRWTVSAGQNVQPGGEATYLLGLGDDSDYNGHTLELVRDAQGQVTHLKEFQKDAKEPFQTWVRKHAGAAAASR